MGAPTTVEEELRKSKALLEQTQRITKVGGWEYDISSRTVSWTAEVYRIYEVSSGFDPNDIGKALEFYSPQDRLLIEGAFWTAVEKGEPYDLELQFVGARGSRKWVRTTAEVERASGKIARVFGNIMDITDRKEAEAQARYLASIVQWSDDAIIGKTLDGIVTSWNRGAERLYGYTKEEMIGRSLSIIIPPSLRDEATRILERIRNGERIEYRETVRLRKDGGAIPVLLTVSPIIDPSGKILGASTIAKDITGRKRSEEALKESETRFRSLMENIPNVAVQGYALDGTVLFWNRASELLYGYSAAEALGGNLLDLIIPEEMREGVTGAIRQMKETGEPIPAGELLLKRKDGSLVPVFSSHAVMNPVGRPTELFCLDIDLTERKRAEEELRRNEGLLLEYVRNSPIYTFIKEVTPDDSRVLYASDNFEQMVGIPGRDMTGRTMEELFPAEFAAKIAADDWAVVANGGVLKLDEDFNGRNYTSIKFPVIHGDKTLLAGYTIDITDRKKAEEEKRNLERQVQQKQKLESLGVLAGGIAHDFNNLLMVVLGHAELALGEVPPMSPARGSLYEITSAARRAADLSLRMLQYVGKAPFVLERVAMRELVGEMEELLGSAIPTKTVLTLDLKQGLPPIEADPGQIRQIVMNLVVNASEAIGDGNGTITVSVDEIRCDEAYLRKTELRDRLAPGRYVRLEVADTGIGMDAETRSRIFDPFFTTKFMGRGLGLAAVQGIVHSHRGALKVSSEPGKGTTFQILFPALEDAGTEVRIDESAPRPDGRGKGTILLVDDEEALLALGERMLKHLGYAVLTAANGREAVDICRERGKEIGLVLLDLTMPEMDGAEAFDEIRRLDPGVRVVLASGYDREDVLPRFEGKGLSGVLQKPYTLANLRETLDGSMPKRLP